MDYFIGKRLLWVPLHNDDYGAQRVVTVAATMDDYCAKLDNGWSVDGFGDCIKRESKASDNVVRANFEPPGYVDDCL